METKQRKIIQKFGNLFDNLHNKLYLESIEFGEGINQIRGLYVQLGLLTEDEEAIAAVVQENQKLKEQLAVAKKDIEQMNKIHKEKIYYKNEYESISGHLQNIIEFIELNSPKLIEKFGPIEYMIYKSMK